MNETILGSATKTVVLGSGRPFVIIGERINPTGRKKLAAEMATGNLSRVRTDVATQVAAGAHMLDLNAGVPMTNEASLMTELVGLVQSLTDAPLCLDSSSPAALAAGLAACKGKALVNSVTGEARSLEAVLPLVKKHGAAVVAICNDESGISQDADARLRVARKILARAADYGIAAADVVVDPLVMPAGAVAGSGRTALDVVRRVATELGLNTVCGASNVSFGLPDRVSLNGAFLAMLIAAGLTAAIVNPLHDEVVAAIMGAEVVVGLDPMCKRWIKRSRRRAANVALTVDHVPQRGERA